MFHTPRNPFREERALESFRRWRPADSRRPNRRVWRIRRAARRAIPSVPVRDLRGGYLLPGLIDTHVHFPQIRVIGGSRQRTARLAGIRRASRRGPHGGCRLCLRHGTALRARACRSRHHHRARFRIAFQTSHSGALSGRRAIRPARGQRPGDVRSRFCAPNCSNLPAEAYRDCTHLIREFHGHGRLLFAVTPRFAVSASEAILEVCQTLMREHEGLRFQTHINENALEIARGRAIVSLGEGLPGRLRAIRTDAARRGVGAQRSRIRFGTRAAGRERSFRYRIAPAATPCWAAGCSRYGATSRRGFVARSEPTSAAARVSAFSRKRFRPTRSSGSRRTACF